MCYWGCVDETPTIPVEKKRAVPHTFLHGCGVKKFTEDSLRASRLKFHSSFIQVASTLHLHSCTTCSTGTRFVCEFRSVPVFEY